MNVVEDPSDGQLLSSRRNLTFENPVYVPATNQSFDNLLEKLALQTYSPIFDESDAGESVMARKFLGDDMYRLRFRGKEYDARLVSSAAPPLNKSMQVVETALLVPPSATVPQQVATVIDRHTVRLDGVEHTVKMFGFEPRHEGVSGEVLSVETVSGAPEVAKVGGTVTMQGGPSFTNPGRVKNDDGNVVLDYQTGTCEFENLSNTYIQFPEQVTCRYVKVQPADRVEAHNMRTAVLVRLDTATPAGRWTS